MAPRHTSPIHVLLVPGADGRPFPEDRAEAASRGVVVHEMTLPAITGHPIDARLRYFDAVGADIERRVAAIRSAAPGAQVHAIGRNHGGSLLAHAVARGARVDAMVLPGVIPELSTFRLRSEHPSARAFREALGTPEAVARIAELRPHDLTTSLLTVVHCRVLLQVGADDPWLDAASHAVSRVLADSHQVSWHDDDHAMVAPATLAERWAFLAGSV